MKTSELIQLLSSALVDFGDKDIQLFSDENEESEEIHGVFRETNPGILVICAPGVGQAYLETEDEM